MLCDHSANSLDLKCDDKQCPQSRPGNGNENHIGRRSYDAGAVVDKNTHENNGGNGREDGGKHSDEVNPVGIHSGNKDHERKSDDNKLTPGKKEHGTKDGKGASGKNSHKTTGVNHSKKSEWKRSKEDYD
ncbi:hypothetical protein K7432_013380 [Basidiobolus ranarum]|uniref:Uncharacterized protein n=1 Tax=Basidiobolus ranarum TaxID=34480 RepID=A0ABR2VQW6_9FUNG